MITHRRQYIKSESPVAIGASQLYSFGRRRSSSSSSSSALGSATSGEMPMKLEERLNELESNAVRALLSLGEAFVKGGSPYKAQVQMKKEPELYSFVKPPHHQQHQQQAQNPQPVVSIARSVIVKAEPGIGYQEEQRNHNLSVPTHQPPPPPISQPHKNAPPLHTGQSHFMRELNGSLNKSLKINSNHQNQVQAISLTPITKTSVPSGTALQYNGSTSLTSIAPVSIQPVNTAATSSTAPVISTIFYQIPASVSAGSVTNGTSVTATPVMSPSFTIIPAPNARTVIPLPVVSTNATSLVKIEPGIVSQNGTPLNWNNIQVLKVSRNSVENANNGITTFSPLASVTALTPSVGTSSQVVSGASGGPIHPPTTNATGTPDGVSPTKSRTRRRSQSTTKGRSSRVSSNSSELMITSNVEGLPSIVVDGYEIAREIWAKAFLQNDIIHAAGTLFNALFSSEEIKNCTLNGRNGTRQLCPEKRQAIFKIVAWMKNKCQDPYSFNKSPEESKILNREEQMMIEKKVFVERRYQTSRKIRDTMSSHSHHTQSPPTMSPSPTTMTYLNQSAANSSTVTPSSSSTSSFSPNSNNSLASGTNTHDGGTPSPPPLPLSSIGGPECRRRDSNGSFSSIGTGDGIPKITLIQSSEIIANYFQSAEPLPVPGSTSLAGSIINITNHQNDGPPPMKMQKVG